MANEEVILNNYSDDSKIKEFMTTVLAPQVFHDIPLNILNTGHFSLVNEYISQITEQIAYTSSFYFNESFITKAVLPDSIYSEAAIFNIGYSFATPASCNFLLELKIKDIYDNAVYNADNGLYEFILDKNTKFNLPEGFVYSLDYDILIQFKDISTSSIESSIPAWNVQYINRDVANVCATNKNIYITYRVTNTWLCLLIQANEYERQVHTVVNNMTGGVPNEDKVIMCENHIAGFDVKYIDSKGNERYLTRDHILAIHDSVTDNEPYVHYIMDNPQTIRFMWQLNGNRYFIPDANSSFEITIYTCHGKSANSPDYKNDEQPQVITSANKYSNNANVMKAAFVISGSMGGSDIGTVETVRRETIEAYNTANVLSTDHDIDEWFKTFFFKNILYPFFFKRRDDPWGRLWSGYIALKSDDDYVYRTNTLHGKIPYEVLYNNSDNTVSNNEIIIPPGWIWTYYDENDEDNYTRFTVTPYTKGDGKTIETAKTLASISDKFVFANPFGIRIQKQPFAIGYFNPWINDYVTATKINKPIVQHMADDNDNDISYIYHATPIITNIKRTYKDDHYTFTTYILPNMAGMNDGRKLVEYVRENAVEPQFPKAMWNYFKHPLDLYAASIPIVPLTTEDGYLPFDPTRTYLCVKTKNRIDDNKWELSNIWIEDLSSVEPKNVYLPITAEKMYMYGSDAIWGDNGINSGYEVYVTGDTEIEIYPSTTDSPITFERIKTQNYYEMRLGEDMPTGTISRIVVGEATKTELTKYSESQLVKIGKSYSSAVYINVYYNKEDNEGNTVEERVTYTIKNAANVYMPYQWNPIESTPGSYQFDMHNVGSGGIILYADMKPSPESGTVNYYRIPFSELPLGDAMFYIHSNQLPLYKNNMRVIMHTIMNGAETGRVEMQPVSLESDGSYKFDTTMYPLTELIDIDNRIKMASIEHGGGSWKSVNGSLVSLDASDPQIKITILVRSDFEDRDSEIEIGDDFTGFRIIDEYMLDNVDLVQELKEMRSVVNFREDYVEIQLMPFVEYLLMNDDRFESFVSSFTQVHKAIEPVIFKRLEGNHYLDCKLIATYGLPHSYVSDTDDTKFWPDLNVQIAFDIKLKNMSLATNTISELRNDIKSYFNRLTTVHTAVEKISMDNDIYISHVIQKMEEHLNVAYVKFRGWYTNEKDKENGNYMDANTQAIVQKWRKFEDMRTDELERYTPEMFVLDDDNIVLNIIK